MENARYRILDEAAMLFGRYGYENSSMSDVANSIGVSKAAIYHYFHTKQEIYDAIIVRTLCGLIKEVEVEVEAEAPGLPRLRRFMIAHATYFEEHFWSFVTMLVGFGGMASPSLKEEALRLRHQYEALLRSIVKEGIEIQALRDVDVASTCRGILSLLNWMARWFKPGMGSTAADVAQTYFELFISNGLRRPSFEN